MTEAVTLYSSGQTSLRKELTISSISSRLVSLQSTGADLISLGEGKKRGSVRGRKRKLIRSNSSGATELTLKQTLASLQQQYSECKAVLEGRKLPPVPEERQPARVRRSPVLTRKASVEPKVDVGLVLAELNSTPAVKEKEEEGSKRRSTVTARSAARAAAKQRRLQSAESHLQRRVTAPGHFLRSKKAQGPSVREKAAVFSKGADRAGSSRQPVSAGKPPTSPRVLTTEGRRGEGRRGEGKLKMERQEEEKGGRKEEREERERKEREEREEGERRERERKEKQEKEREEKEERERKEKVAIARESRPEVPVKRRWSSSCVGFEEGRMKEERPLSAEVPATVIRAVIKEKEPAKRISLVNIDISTAQIPSPSPSPSPSPKVSRTMMISPTSNVLPSEQVRPQVVSPISKVVSPYSKKLNNMSPSPIPPSSPSSLAAPKGMTSQRRSIQNLKIAGKVSHLKHMFDRQEEGGEKPSLSPSHSPKQGTGKKAPSPDIIPKQPEPEKIVKSDPLTSRPFPSPDIIPKESEGLEQIDEVPPTGEGEQVKIDNLSPPRPAPPLDYNSAASTPEISTPENPPPRPPSPVGYSLEKMSDSSDEAGSYSSWDTSEEEEEEEEEEVEEVEEVDSGKVVERRVLKSLQ